MIAIVDTGGANFASIQNALERIGEATYIGSDKKELDKASHLILPGVGHALRAAEKLKENDLFEYLQKETRPVLGICLGMQLLYSLLEEGPTSGLAILSGTVSALQVSADFRVPHMGWSPLDRITERSSLLQGIAPSASFYFIHSFATPMNSYVTSTSTSPFPIAATVEFKNFYGTQFHPEKSGAAGESLLKNFLSLKSYISPESLP
ncbi:MAG: imidazole glycerol phosphate synthase subunit HisH [Bdellovibrionaceae bacterium]|nr:imidazole glycerol phosphate synthase subunit HisH [Pseudobdellovibrionaceae bacterium]